MEVLADTKRVWERSPCVSRGFVDVSVDWIISAVRLWWQSSKVCVADMDDGRFNVCHFIFSPYLVYILVPRYQFFGPTLDHLPFSLNRLGTSLSRGARAWLVASCDRKLRTSQLTATCVSNSLSRSTFNYLFDLAACRCTNVAQLSISPSIYSAHSTNAIWNQV